MIDAITFDVREEPRTSIRGQMWSSKMRIAAKIIERYRSK